MTSHRYQALKAQLREAVRLLSDFDYDKDEFPDIAAFLAQHADIVKEINQ